MLCLMCRAHCLTVICAHPEYISVFGEGSGGSNAARLPAYVYVFNCWKNNKKSWMKNKAECPDAEPTHSITLLSADHKPDLVICPLLLSRFILYHCNSTHWSRYGSI